jgi:hypothetical protein
MEQNGINQIATDEAIFPTTYTVTVDQLLIWLEEYPGDTPIVMSKDAEGNGFSPLSDVSATHYMADTTWSGECHDQDDGAGDEDGVGVVCLWPVN